MAAKFVALFDFNTPGSTAIIKVQDSIDELRISMHCDKGRGSSENVKKISKRKCQADNGFSCDIYQIDGVLYEVFADWSCRKKE